MPALYHIHIHCPVYPWTQCASGGHLQKEQMGGSHISLRKTWRRINPRAAYAVAITLCLLSVIKLAVQPVSQRWAQFTVRDMLHLFNMIHSIESLGHVSEKNGTTFGFDSSQVWIAVTSAAVVLSWGKQAYRFLLWVRMSMSLVTRNLSWTFFPKQEAQWDTSLTELLFRTFGMWHISLFPDLITAGNACQMYNDKSNDLCTDLQHPGWNVIWFTVRAWFTWPRP